MSHDDLSIAVVGGGIGGLAAALSLLRAGFDVQVFEQAAALMEVGAGIQISPNASRLLHRLGLGAALDRTGVRPVAVHQRRWDDGRTLQRAPLGEAVEAAFGAPYYHFHRADLLKALADALPPERLHLGHRLAGFTDLGDRVELRFAHGERVAARILVGADGIHSTVRGELFGPEQPRFTGCIAYRGLVPAERLTHLELEVLANNWMGPGGHFVHYFVASGRLVNFVAINERETWTRESWTDRGKVADALAAFKGWHPHLGAHRPRPPRPLVGGPRHPPRRRLPCHAALHGAGRRAVHRGRRNPDGLSGPARRSRRRLGLAALRGAPAAPGDPLAGDVSREQDALPPVRRPRAARARRAARHAGRPVDRGPRLALQPRCLRHRRRPRAPLTDPRGG